jgi:hypothetical protein
MADIDRWFRDERHGYSVPCYVKLHGSPFRESPDRLTSVRCFREIAAAGAFFPVPADPRSKQLVDAQPELRPQNIPVTIPGEGQQVPECCRFGIEER